MAAQPINRKLAAILAADVVGYSRLMSRDEEATLRDLEDRRDFIDGVVARHDGRVFNSAGDSVMAEFSSPVEAMRGAVEIQRGLAERDKDVARERRMAFRIGINLGDVMVAGDNLLGDSVNVAARLEQLANPGGILVSGTVYDQVKHKLKLGFEECGERTLKNIADPVRTYRVLLAPQAAGKLVLQRGSTGPTRLRAAVLVGVVLAAAAVFILVRPPSPAPQQTVGTGELAPSPPPDPEVVAPSSTPESTAATRKLAPSPPPRSKVVEAPSPDEFAEPVRKVPVDVPLPPKRPFEATKASPSEPETVQPVPPNMSEDAVFDLAFWESIQESDNAADHRAYLKAFPDGRFAALAGARLETIKRLEAEEEKRRAHDQSAERSKLAPDGVLRREIAQLPSSPVSAAERERIRSHFQNEESTVREALATYNERHRIASAAASYTYWVRSIDSVEVLAAWGDDAILRLQFAVGRRTAMSRHDYVYHVRWRDERLTFIGHEIP